MQIHVHILIGMKIKSTLLPQKKSIRQDNQDINTTYYTKIGKCLDWFTENNLCLHINNYFFIPEFQLSHLLPQFKEFFF